MANTAKSAGAASAPKDVPFEEALKQLETIVDEMEGGELPLETMLTRFEQGTRLVQVCATKLEEAEVKIQKLEKNAGGDVVLRPLADAEPA